MSPAQLFDIAAVFVFALTGGLAASRAQLDIVGFVFLAGLTAVGGGTARDVILDRNPVFWVGDPLYIGVAASAGILMYFAASHIEQRYRLLIWLDALALPAAVAAGLSVTQATGAALPVVVIMGVVTGCLGGLMRDVVCNEVPLILRHGELYATAAFAGALSGVVVLVLTEITVLWLIAAAAVTFALRAGSLALGWRLPSRGHVPPREKR